MNLTEIAKNKIKSKVKSKVKKVAFKTIKPFLPFIIIIVGIFFVICTVIDVVFIQEVQNDSSLMSEVEQELRNKCIEKAKELNTCNNYKEGEKTNYLLDVDDREIGKEIEWSHLYSIMAFHNMSNGTTINENLLNEVSKSFTSTFTYERNIITTETIIKDEEGNEKKTTKEETQYLLIESNTIVGHYKYYYKEITTEKENTKITKKVFTNEELIGEKYTMIKEYLKEKLHIRENDIEIDT